jgi:hypothetical protein
MWLFCFLPRRKGEPISSEPLRRIGPGHPPGRDPERTAATAKPPTPIAAAGIGRCLQHNAAFHTGFLNRRLRGALGALRSAHDLIPQFVVTRLPGLNGIGIPTATSCSRRLL